MDSDVKGRCESNLPIGCFYETEGHRLLAGGHSGLLTYDDSLGQWLYPDSTARSLKVNHICAGRGHLWLCTSDDGIVRLDPDQANLRHRYVRQNTAIAASDGKAVVPNYFFACSGNADTILWATSSADLHAFGIDHRGMLQPIDLRDSLYRYSTQEKMLSELIFKDLLFYGVAHAA